MAGTALVEGEQIASSSNNAFIVTDRINEEAEMVKTRGARFVRLNREYSRTGLHDASIATLSQGRRLFESHKDEKLFTQPCFSQVKNR